MSLISLLIPSRRPHQLIGLFDSIEQTISDPDAVEVLVKIDDDMPEALETIEREAEKRPFRIKWLNTPRLGGVFTLWVGLEDLFSMSDPDSYFVMAITDETRFLSAGWDETLGKYVGFFDDDAFRLRISNSRFVNYPHHFSCCTKPESFAIFTRRWLELTEGICNLCYGSDCYHQSIMFHLGLGRRSYFDIWQEEGHFRDIQVHDIAFGGFEFGQDIAPTEALTRSLYMYREWKRINAHAEQRNIAYLAKKIVLYCWAMKNKLENFRFERREADHTVAAIDDVTGNVLRRISYNPPRVAVYMRNLFLNAIFIRHQFRLYVFQLSNPIIAVSAPDENAQVSVLRKIRNLTGNAIALLWAPVDLSFEVLVLGILRLVLMCTGAVLGRDGHRGETATTETMSTLASCIHESKRNLFLTARAINKHANVFIDKRPPVGELVKEWFNSLRRFVADPGVRATQRRETLRRICVVAGVGVILPIRTVQIVLRATFPATRLIAVKTADMVFSPLDFVTRIPPAGLERPQKLNPLSFWFRFRMTRYPVAGYEEMVQHRERLLQDKSTWARQVYGENKPTETDRSTR